MRVIPKLLMQIWAVLFLLVAIAPTSRAQGGGIGNTTSTPVAGVPHDYITGLNEIVDPANGALSIRIPQPVPTERGQNWPAYAFIYDSNRFTLMPEWSTSSTNPPITSLGALPYGGGPSAGIGMVGYTSNFLDVCQQTSQYSCTRFTCHQQAGYVFADPDGGLHGLGLQVGIPLTNNTSNDCQYFSVRNYYIGGDERYKASMDSNTLAVTVVDLHGNRPVGEDTNGNYRDTTHRTAPVPAQSTIQLQTVNNVSQAYSVSGTSEDGTNSCDVTSITPPLQPPSISVARSVTLPNGQQYIFQYDLPKGLINKITYPTGATVTYTWSVIPKSQGVQYKQTVVTGLGGTCFLQYDWFAITKRVVSFDGVTNAQEQDFAYNTVWPNAQTYKWTSKTTTVTTKDLIRGTSFNTVYNYSPMFPPAESDQPWEDLGYVPVENTVQYFGTDGSWLKTTTKSWATSTILSAECTTLNFEARYLGSSLGRFMTPDQLGAGQHPGNPQSWNLYSYVQNNPLNLTDPTGEYVCGSTLNQEQCTNFQKNLDTAQTAANNLKDKYGEDSEQYQSAQRAIDAYGQAGVDNGVTIQVGKTGDYGANTSVAGTTGPKTADNPTGQQITVTFNQNQLNKVSDFNALLEGHEGVHVANGSDWVQSGFSNNANPSHYQDEFDAYVVSSHIAEGLGYSTYDVGFGNRNYPLFNSAWSRDAQNLAINTIINKEYPKNQLDAFSRNTKPKPR
jgi:RHS repeat-associated protein